MIYRIKEPWSLRGWKQLPHALVNRLTRQVVALSKTYFDSLTLCDGQIAVLDSLVLPVYRECIQDALKKDFIAACADKDPLAPEQQYHVYPSRFIRVAHWSITGRCNYQCRHCYMEAPDAKYGELSYDACCSVIDQLHECGIFHVSLTGGEPLVRKDFFRLVDRLLQYGIHIDTIYSNGKLVAPALLDAFARRNIYPEFNMSFDGVGWHDWMRGVPGAEQAVLEAFRLCHERGFPTGAEMALHQRNKHTLRETVNRLASLGVSSLKTNPVARVGAWLNHTGLDLDSLSAQELFSIYLEYISHFFADGSPLHIQLGGFFSAGKGQKNYQIPAIKYRNAQESAQQYICGHARQVMYISAEGIALPCMALSGMEAGRRYPSVLEKGLAHCLTDSEYMQLIDTRIETYWTQNPECAQCEFRHLCGGGCRASALETSPDNIMAPDRYHCLLFKGGYVDKIQAAARKSLE